MIAGAVRALKGLPSEGEEVGGPLCRCLAHHSHEAQPPPLPTRSWAEEGASTPLVSIVTPTTTERHWCHANLYRCFDMQTWPNKEVRVLGARCARKSEAASY